MYLKHCNNQINPRGIHLTHLRLLFKDNFMKIMQKSFSYLKKNEDNFNTSFELVF